MPLALSSLAIALLLAVRLGWEPHSIASGAMTPTLLVGDTLLAWRGPFAVARSDVVVFAHPVTGDDVVMRVVGLPGDRIQMRDGRLLLNDEPVPTEPAGRFVEVLEPQGAAGIVPSCQGDPVAMGEPCAADLLTETLPGAAPHGILDLGPRPQDDTGVLVVPAGQVLVMGDNRDDSLDSRFPQASGGPGFIPFANIKARADLVVLSWNGPTLGDPATWRPDRTLLAVD